MTSRFGRAADITELDAQRGKPTTAQRDTWLTEFTSTRASGVVLIRLHVGSIFACEGILQLLRPDQLGPGRFDKAGIPAPGFFAYLDGIFEIGCGVLIWLGC